jgi:hypothetical protein
MSRHQAAAGTLAPTLVHCLCAAKASKRLMRRCRSRCSVASSARSCPGAAIGAVRWPRCRAAPPYTAPGAGIRLAAPGWPAPLRRSGLAVGARPWLVDDGHMRAGGARSGRGAPRPPAIPPVPSAPCVPASGDRAAHHQSETRLSFNSGRRPGHAAGAGGPSGSTGGQKRPRRRGDTAAAPTANPAPHGATAARGGAAPRAARGPRQSWPPRPAREPGGHSRPHLAGHTSRGPGAVATGGPAQVRGVVQPLPPDTTAQPVRPVRGRSPAGRSRRQPAPIASRSRPPHAKTGRPPALHPPSPQSGRGHRRAVCG